MRIGIDFDNTIAKYEELFKEVAITEGFIKRNWNGNGKTVLRNYLRSQPGGETTWMKLQGLVYGKYMHRAKMMPGVANFFLSCKIRNHRVFIVSHKTEYGHFDPEKISLRREALRWMETKRFFDPEYFGINRKNVYFADTREEKLKKIAQLKCNWFIDDLPEVFTDTLFPADTKKILFSKYNPGKLPDNTLSLENWRKISKKILDQTTDDDVISWIKWVMGGPIHHIEKISGRGNSSIHKVIALDGNNYALKYYPDQLKDKRPRLNTEFQTLQILHQNNINNVPKSVEKSDDLNLGLYEWINGNNIGKPSVDALDQAIDFVEKLYSLSQIIDGNDINLASEACLSANQLVSQIENRLLRLKQESKDFQELSIFLKRAFEPLWAKVKDKCISLWPLESRYNSLPKEKQTLSPSDYGFHNCLKGNDGSLTFLDFDYFGWDDPVKLTADFIWHPAMNLNRELTDKWTMAMLDIFSVEPEFEERLKAAMPLYGLRWAMIVLNEFLPGFAEKRREAGEVENYNLEKSQKIQLKKAKNYCSNVKTMVSQVTFA